MRDLKTFLALVAALTIAAPAFAQDSAGEPASAGTTSENPAGTAAEAEPAESGAAAETEEIGKPYVKQTYGDWQIRCIHAPIGQSDPCQMYQLLVDANSNPVAELSLVTVREGGETVAGATVLTPLETFLPPGIEIAIDGRTAGRVPFLACTQQHCMSEFPLKAADISTFKRGRVATVTIVPLAATDQKVPLEASLSGFTAAYDALVAEQK